MRGPGCTARIGVVCSAGGSSFFSAAEMLDEVGLFVPSDFLVVTDRLCGAEDRARSAGVCHVRIDDRDPRSFSSRAADALRGHGCGHVLLLFSRLVTEELFAEVPTLNIHPSLLPAYPGMRAVRQATEARCPLQGATLHVVVAACDAGPVVAQVVSPTDPSAGIEERRRLAWVQQTYLAMVAIELVIRRSISIDAAPSRIEWAHATRRTASASPALHEPALVEAFTRFQRTLGMEAIVP